jgi:hypothetical protein
MAEAKKPSHPQEPRPPAQIRYQHIMDADGKVMATVDTKNNSIEYISDPKKVVERVILLSNSLAGECQHQIQALNDASKDCSKIKPNHQPK